MDFNVQTKVTDIIMFNSRNLGALIVDEKPHVKSWDEPQYSIQNLGIEESYGFGVLNEGQAIAVAKNVKVRQNMMSTPEALIISLGAGSPVFEGIQRSCRRHAVRPQRGQLSTVTTRCLLSRADAELKSPAGDSRSDAVSPSVHGAFSWLGASPGYGS
jgi:hypothetical protein